MAKPMDAEMDCSHEQSCNLCQVLAAIPMEEAPTPDVHESYLFYPPLKFNNSTPRSIYHPPK